MATNAVSTTKKSNRRPLILAIVFGALSALLVLTYLQSAKKDAPTSVAASVPVVFALRDIPERTQIKEGMLEVKQIPVDARHQLAMDSKDLAVGKLTRVPIAAGEQVLTAKLAGEVKDVGFSGTIPDGKRAVAIAITEVIASGGQISPGDYVDVIGVFEVGGSPKTDASGFFGDSAGGDKAKVFTAMTVLQHVQVLAVAQQSDPNIPAGGAKRDPNAKPGDAKSATLAVNPEDAEKLFLAEQIGKLRLSLRPFSDDDQRKVQPVYNTLSDLIGN
ncbi:MAG: Flp pilus assembly protein CpaB [Chloroflexi bacterium]|nr:Flp pilus assembly protein CpaB [Chloroflexota bacterium]